MAGGSGGWWVGGGESGSGGESVELRTMAGQSERMRQLDW